MTTPKKERGVRISYDGKDWSITVGDSDVELLVEDLKLHVDGDNCFDPVAELRVFVDQVNVVADAEVTVAKPKKLWWRRLWRTA